MTCQILYEQIVFYTILNTFRVIIANTVIEYKFFKVFEYLFGTTCFASIWVFIPNNF